MRTSSISLLAALAGVIALLFCLAAVPLQQKAVVAAPFCKTTEGHEHERHHGVKHAHRGHRAHAAHGHAGAHHQQHQQHAHVPPTVTVPTSPPAIHSISPAATLKLDVFDAPSPLSVAEAEKAHRQRP